MPLSLAEIRALPQVAKYFLFMGSELQYIGRSAKVLRRVGLSHVSIWKLEREGKFPPRFKLTGDD